MQAQPPLHSRLPKFSQVVGENCRFDMLKGSEKHASRGANKAGFGPFSLFAHDF